MVGKTTIPEYFAGQNVLVTGATGFMGKVLVEKILRCCPGVNKIYILIRPKKGIQPQDRWNVITERPLFDILKEKQPDALNKVVAIEGDTVMKKLGLSDFDRQLLIDNVTTIFHVAANVLFFENIAEMFQMNVRGTMEMLEIAKEMKNIKCFLHVSTAFSNCDKKISIGEEVFPAIHNWRHIVKCIEVTDAYTLGCLTYKILAAHPNVYTLSKSLAEQVIVEYSQYFPCIIMRPSVVVNALKEPLPGWGDSWNGPTLLGVLSGYGIMKILMGKDSVHLDYVSVDNAINGFLVATWDTGNRNLKKGLDVYNCSFGSKLTTTTGEFRQFGKELAEENPFAGMLWRPGGFITSSTFIFYTVFFLIQVIPAGILSSVQWCIGQKPRLWKIMQKIIVATKATAFFVTKTFDFPNQNFRGLQRKLLPEDVTVFSVEHDEDLTPRAAFFICGLGTKKYVLKEREDNLEERKRIWRRFYWLDIFTKGVLFLLASYWSWLLLRKIAFWILS